jgi:simple sugar transport system permease protein
VVTQLTGHRATRFGAGILLAILIFAIFLIAFGKDPLRAYSVIFQGALGDSYGWGEILVKATPILLCALAAAIPARVGLINVGAPGQLWMGAWAATWVALTFGYLPGPVVIPLMMLAGFAGGAVWAGLAGIARVTVGLNETISTLLLNYVAPLFVNVFIYGPWKDPGSFNWPYTAGFSQAARLPTIGGSRVHLGIVFALVAVAATYFVLQRTNWGYRMRVIGGNGETARRFGLPIRSYLLVAMLIGGGLAGLAGMGEVSAIQARLQPGIAPTEGYLGFLASWLAVHNPLGIVAMTAVLATIAVGGDVLQIGININSAAVNILIGLLLLCVMGTRRLVPSQGR